MGIHAPLQVEVQRLQRIYRLGKHGPHPASLRHAVVPASYVATASGSRSGPSSNADLLQMAFSTAGPAINVRTAAVRAYGCALRRVAG